MVEKKEAEVEVLEEQQDEEIVDELELPETSQHEMELVLGYREFEIPGKELTVRVYKPSVGIDSKADAAYAREFSRLLQEENPPMTRRQMERELLAKEVWTETDEEELLEKQQAVSATRLKLETEKSKERVSKKKLETLTLDFAKAQEEFLILNGTKQSYFANTIEGLAEECRWMAKIVLCTTKVKSKKEIPLWENVNVLLDEKDAIIMRRVMLEATLYWQGVDANVFDGLPGWDDALYVF